MVRQAGIDDDEQSTGGTNLIRSYGEFWSRDAVDWASGKLPGHRRHYKLTSKNKTAKAKHCDAWKQRGVYALYKDFQLVYVGLAVSAERGIGQRLKDHTEKPRMKDRWDSFSWFGIDAYEADGKVNGAGKFLQVSVPDLVRTLELITILISAPPLNRSQGRFKNSERIVQAPRQHGRTAQDLIGRFKELLNEARGLG